MTKTHCAHIFLDDDTRARAEARKHNFVGKMTDAIAAHGWTTRLRDLAEAEQISALAETEYALVQMEGAAHPRALTFRRAYVGAFWRIERTAIRSEFEIAKARFDAASVDAGAARRFAQNWRRWAFGDIARKSRREGFVYVPLQARLLDKRARQACSPVEMIKEVLRRDTRRWIVATLHPRWQYSPQEVKALKRLLDAHPRLSLGSAPSEQLLRDCDYVVTESSAVAFKGYFFAKPAILFQDIDFHHIALNVRALGAADAFAAVGDLALAYDQYLFWFLKQNAIGAGADTAGRAIAGRLSDLGWPISG
ncbi:MAG: hypothetical protein KJN93_09245 [Alphaproteobacteria bacterium]|nr:hypothetical protein [Alphaproteobacteria bacterium]NNF24193.1 hypothetical protein [Paracoccaceae bacterium]